MWLVNWKRNLIKKWEAIYSWNQRDNWRGNEQKKNRWQISIRHEQSRKIYQISLIQLKSKWIVNHLKAIFWNAHLVNIMWQRICQLKWWNRSWFVWGYGFCIAIFWINMVLIYRQWKEIPQQKLNGMFVYCKHAALNIKKKKEKWRNIDSVYT